MNLQPYHVCLPVRDGGTAPPPSFLKRAANEIGGWPTPVKIIAGVAGGALVVGGIMFAPAALAAAAAAEAGSLAVAGAAIASGAAETGALAVTGLLAAGGVVGGAGVATVDYYVNKDESGYLKLVDSSQALQEYKTFENLGTLVDGYYIEHPRRPSELLPAKLFHEIIENEQAQEIIRFIRSQVRATSIKIVRNKCNTAKGGASRKVKGIKVKAEAASEDSLKTLVQFTYETPILVESDKPIVWKHIYQELADGLKGVSGGGTAAYTLSKVGSFSLSVELSALIGANIEYLNDRYLEVELKYL